MGRQSCGGDSGSPVQPGFLRRAHGGRAVGRGGQSCWLVIDDETREMRGSFDEYLPVAWYQPTNLQLHRRTVETFSAYDNNDSSSNSRRRVAKKKPLSSKSVTTWNDLEALRSHSTAPVETRGDADDEQQQDCATRIERASHVPSSRLSDII